MANGAGAEAVTHYFAPKLDFPNDEDMIEGVLCWMLRGRREGDRTTREREGVTCPNCRELLTGR